MIRLTKKNNIIIFALLSMAFVFPSQASNIAFLKQAVIADFTEQDIQQLIKEYKFVLQNKQPGDEHNWQSKNAKNGGKIKMIKQYRQNDNMCKRLMFKNYSKQKTLTSYFNFCLIKSEWQLSI